MIRGRGRKIIVFLICFSFIAEQTGFAQVNAPADLSRLIHAAPAAREINSRPAYLRAVEYDASSDDLQIMLDKGTARQAPADKGHPALLKYFFTGLALPNSAFWVNLRPDSPDGVIDPRLAMTDLGRVMLAADLQLKKDLAGYTAPDTATGKEYWAKLYKKAEEIYGPANVSIPTLTRPWIVPGEILLREARGNVYIYKAQLEVKLESDYLKDSPAYDFSDSRRKELNQYATALVRAAIIPKLTRDINTSKKYAELRQAYFSLILAQWFKKRFRGITGKYAGMVDSGKLEGLASEEAWSAQSYFEAYRKSFRDGEYNVSESARTLSGPAIRQYTSGGMNLVVPIPEGGTLVSTAEKVTAFSANPAIRLDGGLVAVEMKNDEAREFLIGHGIDIKKFDFAYGEIIAAYGYAGFRELFISVGKNVADLFSVGLGVAKETFGSDLEYYWPDLVRLGVAAGDGSWNLFQYGIPSVKLTFGEELKEYWPDLVRLGIAAEGMSGHLFYVGFPGAQKTFGNKMKEYWPDLVRLGIGAKKDALPLFQVGFSTLKKTFGDEFEEYWPDLVRLGIAAESYSALLFIHGFPAMQKFLGKEYITANWRPLVSRIISACKRTNEYNRERIMELLCEAYPEVIQAKPNADYLKVLDFALEVLNKEARLANHILEGILEAIKQGSLDPADLENRKEEIFSFIGLTHSFSPALFRLYQQQGEHGLSEIFVFAGQVLQDRVGEEEFIELEDILRAKGITEDALNETVVASIQIALSSSGASFVKKDEIIGLYRKYRESGDRRQDIPEELRDKDFGSGRKIPLVEYRLKDGEVFDPGRAIHDIISGLRNKDRDVNAGKKEEAEARDRTSFKDSLTAWLRDYSDNGKQNAALKAFYAWASHNDLLGEKIDAISGDYSAVALLEPLFTDKDNLSVLVREVSKDIGEAGFPDKAARVEDGARMAKQLRQIWRDPRLEKRQKGLRALLSRFSRADIETKILPAVDDAQLRQAVREVIKTGWQGNKVSEAEIVARLFAEPYAQIAAEKQKFEVQDKGEVDLEFRVVKGIPYGLWGLNAGVCIATDLELWQKKEFMLLAMIDKNTKKVCGFAHLFSADDNGKNILTVPGIEPSVEFLSEVKPEAVYPLIEEALIGVAKAGGYEGVYLPVEPNILSNRPDIGKIAAKKYAGHKTDIARVDWNTLPQEYPFSEVYEIWTMPAVQELQSDGGAMAVGSAVADRAGVPAVPESFFTVTTVEVQRYLKTYELYNCVGFAARDAGSGAFALGHVAEGIDAKDAVGRAIAGMKARGARDVSRIEVILIGNTAGPYTADRELLSGIRSALASAGVFRVTQAMVRPAAGQKFVSVLFDGSTGKVSLLSDILDRDLQGAIQASEELLAKYDHKPVTRIEPFEIGAARDGGLTREEFGGWFKTMGPRDIREAQKFVETVERRMTDSLTTMSMIEASENGHALSGMVQRGLLENRDVRALADKLAGNLDAGSAVAADIAEMILGSSMRDRPDSSAASSYDRLGPDIAVLRKAIPFPLMIPYLKVLELLRDDQDAAFRALAFMDDDMFLLDSLCRRGGVEKQFYAELARQARDGATPARAKQALELRAQELLAREIGRASSVSFRAPSAAAGRLFAYLFKKGEPLSAPLIAGFFRAVQIGLRDGARCFSSFGLVAENALRGSGPLRSESLPAPKPDFASRPAADIPVVDGAALSALLEGAVFTALNRTGVFIRKDNSCIAFKALKSGEDPGRLAYESEMFDYFNRLKAEGVPLTGAYPRASLIGGERVVRVRPAELPASFRDALGGLTGEGALDTAGGYYTLMAYATGSPDYFTYLTDVKDDRMFMEASRKNIHDLFVLARYGLIHPDLIELFHNHVSSRVDEGKYIWDLTSPREPVFNDGAGRLDTWVQAVRYPNMRLSGPADLAELTTIKELSLLEGPHSKYLGDYFWRFGKPNLPRYVLSHFLGNYLLAWTLVDGARLRASGRLDWKDPRELSRQVREIYDAAFTAFGGTVDPVAGQLVDWEMFARQMAYFMSDAYVPGLIAKDIPTGIYAPDTRVGYALKQESSRGWTPSGWKADGVNPDLGPVNGPLPLTEFVKATYIYNMFMISGFIRDHAASREASGKLEEYLKDKSGVSVIRGCDIWSPEGYAEAAGVLREQGILRIDLSRGSGRSPRETARAFDGLSAALGREFGDSRAGLETVFAELLDNAFLHGNKFDYSLPLFIRVDRSVPSGFEIYNVISPQELTAVEKESARTAGLGGQGDAIRWLKWNIRYAREDIPGIGATKAAFSPLPEGAGGKQDGGRTTVTRMVAGSAREIDIQLPVGVDLNAKVEKVTFVFDVDRTLTPAGIKDINPDNLAQIVRAFALAKKSGNRAVQVVMISGSPFKPYAETQFGPLMSEWDWDALAGERSAETLREIKDEIAASGRALSDVRAFPYTRESVERRVIRPLLAALRAEGLEEYAKNIEVRCVSGSETITFDEKGRARYVKEAARVFSAAEQLEVSRALALALLEEVGRTTHLDYREWAGRIGRATAFLGPDGIYAEFMKAVEYPLHDVRCCLADSEINFLLHDDRWEVDGQKVALDAVLKLVEKGLVERRGDRFYFARNGMPCAYSGAPSFAKISLFDKADEIKATPRVGITVGAGDSLTDTFLWGTGAGLWMYLGKREAVSSYEHVIVAMNEQWKDNVQSTGSGVLIGHVLDVMERGGAWGEVKFLNNHFSPFELGVAPRPERDGGMGALIDQGSFNATGDFNRLTARREKEPAFREALDAWRADGAFKRPAEEYRGFVRSIAMTVERDTNAAFGPAHYYPMGGFDSAKPFWLSDAIKDVVCVDRQPFGSPRDMERFIAEADPYALLEYGPYESENRMVRRRDIYGLEGMGASAVMRVKYYLGAQVTGIRYFAFDRVGTMVFAPSGEGAGREFPNAVIEFIDRGTTKRYWHITEDLNALSQGFRFFLAESFVFQSLQLNGAYNAFNPEEVSVIRHNAVEAIIAPAKEMLRTRGKVIVLTDQNFSGLDYYIWKTRPQRILLKPGERFGYSEGTRTGDPAAVYYGTADMLIDPPEVALDGGTANPGVGQRTAQAPGGIDFRALPARMAGPDLTTLFGALPRSAASRDIDAEWSRLQAMVNRGVLPSCQRVKEYAGACYFKGTLAARSPALLSFVAECLKLEESGGCATDPVIKDLLAALEAA